MLTFFLINVCIYQKKVVPLQYRNKDNNNGEPEAKNKSQRHGQGTMTTKKFFAVEVFDNTCNVMGHESGIYGKGDYSWINESLNGGNGEYNMTEEEALEVKADFERIIKERNLEWASVEIDSVEVPVAETMQDIADYYNDADVLDTMELERMIEAAGWVSDCATEWGICHNDTEKVEINDNGEAVVMSI
jgi:hypothetical protein